MQPLRWETSRAVIAIRGADGVFPNLLCGRSERRCSGSSRATKRTRLDAESSGDAIVHQPHASPSAISLMPSFNAIVPMALRHTRRDRRRWSRSVRDTGERIWAIRRARPSSAHRSVVESLARGDRNASRFDVVAADKLRLLTSRHDHRRGVARDLQRDVFSNRAYAARRVYSLMLFADGRLDGMRRRRTPRSSSGDRGDVVAVSCHRHSRRDSPTATEAAFKYFLWRFSSGSFFTASRTYGPWQHAPRGSEA